jgi:hypothetical protein
MTTRASTTLDWLLEKQDPGVRSFALRDLLGAPADDPEARAARRATVRHSPVKEILRPRNAKGTGSSQDRGIRPSTPAPSGR